MLKNARRRPTCKIASKRVRFCRSRCCFAHAMDAKIAQNRRKPDLAWIRPIFDSKPTKFRRLVQSVTWTWPEALRTWKSRLFAKCYLYVLKTRIFMHFRRVLIEDFRGFSQISRFSTLFVHAFERFHVVNGFQMRSFCDSLHGSDQFSNKNPWNFDAWCKVLPWRGQKRSEHENPYFLQSVTGTWSKREF